MHPWHPIHGACRGLFIWFPVTLQSRIYLKKRTMNKKIIITIPVCPRHDGADGVGRL